MSRKKRQLRSGFTTGTASAAAAKAALLMILQGSAPEAVTVELLTGDSLTIPVHRFRKIDANIAQCTVIKDAGDDPDVTHGAEIGATVELLDVSAPSAIASRIEIRGGTGVGQVTKPGLEVPPGQAAINPGPQQMIRQSVHSVLKTHRIQKAVGVEVFVPRGLQLAERTLNARLGIVGGISILGTTGVVTPMSHSAYLATIRSGLSVARATGQRRVVLTTGRRSERFAQQLPDRLPEEAYIQIGDHFKKALQMAAAHSFATVTIAAFFGKALKMALGFGNTHAGRSRLSLAELARWVHRFSGDEDLAGQVRSANTARQAFELIYPVHMEVIGHVAERVVSRASGFTGPAMAIEVILFDFAGRQVYRTTGTAKEGGA